MAPNCLTDDSIDLLRIRVVSDNNIVHIVVPEIEPHGSTSSHSHISPHIELAPVQILQHLFLRRVFSSLWGFMRKHHKKHTNRFGPDRPRIIHYEPVSDIMLKKMVLSIIVGGVWIIKFLAVLLHGLIGLCVPFIVDLSLIKPFCLQHAVNLLVRELLKLS